MLGSPAGSSAVSYEWGTDINFVKKDFGSESSYTQFSPKQQPDYDNKIVSYITAIDEAYINNIVVLRSKTSPPVDYLFVKNRLYTTLEEWGEVDTVKHDQILDSLNKKYGNPSRQQDQEITIYSYSDTKTKVIYFTKRVSGKKYACRVYYYARQLFRLLILD